MRMVLGNRILKKCFETGSPACYLEMKASSLAVGGILIVLGFLLFLKWCSVLLSSIVLLTIERGVDISTTILDLYVYPHFRDFLCQYTASEWIPSNHHTAFHSWAVHNLFKHFSLDGQLHSFHFSPSPDKAAVNILVHLCGLVRVSLWVTSLQVLCWRTVPLKCYGYCQTAFQHIFIKTTP